MRFSKLLLAGISLLALVSCEKLFVADRAGKAIMFSASSEISPLTKTEYSGVVVDGKERINWVDGDPVKIYMHTHSGPGQEGAFNKNYQVVDITTNGVKSSGKVASQTGTLVWQEGMVHDFFSAYPAYFGNAMGTNYDQPYWWSGDGALNFTLPNSQNGVIINNMQYAYMAAVSKGHRSTDSNPRVSLDYYPMVTTLYFTLRNPGTEPIVLKTATLSSTDGTTIVGTYTARVQGDRYVPSTDYVQYGSKRITFGFSGQTLQPGEDLTFAAFLLPRASYNPANLQLSLLTEKGGSSISLENTAVNSFESCKKYNLFLNVQEGELNVDDISVVSNLLVALSGIALLQYFDFRHWGEHPGLYYKNPQPAGSPFPASLAGQRISDEDLVTALAQVKTIDNSADPQYLNYLLTDLTPEDFAIFPNLEVINLIRLGQSPNISIAGLDGLSYIELTGNSPTVMVKDCSYKPDSDGVLTIGSSSGSTDIVISNVKGLKEVILTAGNVTVGGGGNIGTVTIEHCPDLKTIRILQGDNAQIIMPTGTFLNLPSLETLYIEQANKTRSIEVNNCPSLLRFIVCKQTDWLLQNIFVKNCTVLGDAAADNSEFGKRGFNVERVSLDIEARAVNCPALGSSFTALQSNPGSLVTIPFQQ
jgi:hypothetical protein